MVACGIQKSGEVKTLNDASEKTKMHYAYANGLQQQQSSNSDSVYSAFHKVPAVSSISLRRLKLWLLILILPLLLAIAASATAVCMSTKAMHKSDAIEKTLRTHVENSNRGGGCDTMTNERLGSNEPSLASGFGDGRQNMDDTRQNITSTTVRHRPPQQPVAHVSGANVTTDDDYAFISDWKVTNGSDSFCSLIKQRNGRLIVLQAGLYYVYSQVQFLTYAEDDLGATNAQLSHSVWRWNVGYPNGGNKIVMRGTETARWSLRTDVDERASYLGGVFALRAGDEVFVRLSKSCAGRVHRDPKATFFGMFSISDSGAL